MDQFQIHQLPIVIQRPAPVNNQIRRPFPDGKRRRMPRPLVIGVRQAPVNQKRPHLFNHRRWTRIRRRDRNHALRRDERREDLHRAFMPRHEIKIKHTPLARHPRHTGLARSQINIHRPATVNQHPERRETLARHRLNFETNNLHESGVVSQESRVRKPFLTPDSRLPTPDCYLSISPSTMSSVPMMATTSATRCPMDICRRACKLMKEGGRTCTRAGLAVPSETR
jgi:hypothetical protein